MGRLEEALRKEVTKQAKAAGTDATKINTELDIQCAKRGRQSFLRGDDSGKSPRSSPYRLVVIDAVSPENLSNF